MKNVSLQLTEGQIQCLAELERRGLYPNRSEAMRHGVDDLLKLHLTPEERLKVSRSAVTAMTLVLKKGQLKASKEAQDFMAGRAKIDYNKECLIACKVCGITTVHEKGRRAKVENRAIGAVRFLAVRKCKECGTEVA